MPPYVSPLRDAQAAATRRRILTAAAQAFAESGYAGTSLAAIARRAGVSTETVKQNGPKAALVMDAFDLAFAKVPDAELWLVGDGPLKPRVEFGLRRLACENRVRIFPGGPDLLPFYRQASVLALSSLREGLPNVVLEGMACGVPVAATAVGGIPEVVEEGRTGFLSPAADPEALAASFVRLLSDDALQERMAGDARAVALEKYSMAAMVARHEELLWGACGAGAAQGL